jgi:hypothetical protein
MPLTVMLRPSPREVLGARDRIALLFMALASPLAGMMAIAGGGEAVRDAPTAVVFSPWTSAEQAFDRSLAAGHRVLRSGRTGFVVIVAPADGGQAPARRPAGALLLATLAGLAGCLDSADGRETRS